MTQLSDINQQSITIIVIDDDKDVRENMVDLLSTQYQHIQEFDSPKPALATLKAQSPVVIITDLRMPGGDGLEFSKQVNALDPNIPVILMTGYGDITIAVEAMKYGVYDFIEKPVDTDRLLKSVQRAVDKRFLSLSLLHTKQKLEQHQSIDYRIIGHCSMIKQLKQNLLKFAPMDIPVLIYGETGTGKELVARCLHDYSDRSQGPFVTLNCAAIPDHLAEAELFGYVKGAFTDASSSRIGKLEFANGGSLFLDEIESLQLSIQAKLLRVLQDGVITPLGSNKEVNTNFRIISASKEALRNHTSFRQDLYFRLQVGECHIPPLRQRKEDILILFEYFFRKNCESFTVTYSPLSHATKQSLLSYEWPGNIRELINVATRFVINGCKNIDHALVARNDLIEDAEKSLKQQVDDYEENLIRSKLSQHNGRVSAVLEDLKLERRTFNQKTARFQISTADYKKAGLLAKKLMDKSDDNGK
jgi:two-component system C4-dicarboxylate transport response regulator DctD